MIIASNYTELNIYLENIRSKTNNTILENIVSEVYINHNKIINFLLNNLNKIYLNGYIGELDSLITGDLKIKYSKLFKEINKCKSVDVNQLLNFYVDYLEFLIKKTEGKSDIEVINSISHLYENIYDGVCESKIKKELMSKYNNFRPILENKNINIREYLKNAKNRIIIIKMYNN